MTDLAMRAIMPATLTCTLPGCDGYWHYEGTCVAPMAEIPLGDGQLIGELVAEADRPAYVTIFGFNLDIDGTAIRSSAPAELYAQAARFRAFADAVEHAADYFARSGDNDPVIPRLPAPRKPTPDSSAVDHPGDSDPNPDEALRRVRQGAGR